MVVLAVSCVFSFHSSFQRRWSLNSVGTSVFFIGPVQAERLRLGILYSLCLGSSTVGLLKCVSADVSVPSVLFQQSDFLLKGVLP